MVGVGVGREGLRVVYESFMVGSFPCHCKWEVGNKEWECVGCVDV